MKPLVGPNGFTVEYNYSYANTMPLVFILMLNCSQRYSYLCEGVGERYTRSSSRDTQCKYVNMLQCMVTDSMCGEYVDVGVIEEVNRENQEHINLSALRS